LSAIYGLIASINSNILYALNLQKSLINEIF
jgi:hypothetical protein